ncbi:MAG TPA: adenylate/guanylate cyclase domain-containing protein [Dehalococcoidia bacterium]|nr:adenylate/guanylate cyclase domain-containing protein [Dehalococcoidia bacterium]
MQQRVQFCTTSEGVQIAFAVLGEGYPLVLVPGWVSHLELDMEPDSPSRESYEELARHFTLVRYDKRGTGLSDRGVSDFSLEPRLLDLEAVLDRLKLSRYAVRGMSEGGPVAIAHAVRHPERVSHLILQGTYAHLGRSDTTEALIALIGAEWGLGSATMASIFVPSASKEIQERFVVYQREAATRPDAAAMLRANVDTDVRDLLAQVQAATLVIHSETDKAVPFEHARRLAGAIPNATLAQYKGDHAPIGSYEQINRMIMEFVTPDDAADRAAPATVSGLLTIMFTDIEASTTMTRRLGDAGAQRVLHTHNGIIRDALRANAGTEIKHTGDGIMASFATASSALTCASSIQRAFEEHNERDPDSRVRVRIGLNAGEPVAEDGDLFGTSVQLAARICARAEPGQILAANVVRELAAGKQFLFADHGDVVLRGFEDPVHVFEVSWRG